MKSKLTINYNYKLNYICLFRCYCSRNETEKYKIKDIIFYAEWEE